MRSKEMASTNRQGHFFESGTYEAEQIDYEQRIGTLWDLLRRGETMRKLLSQYFWTKDFSVYRVSGVRFTMLGYVRTVFQKIADNVHDDSLFKEMNGIYNQYQPADDESVFWTYYAIVCSLIAFHNWQTKRILYQRI